MSGRQLQNDDGGAYSNNSNSSVELLLFLFSGLAIGVFIQQLMSRSKNSVVNAIPYSVVMFVLGLTLAGYSKSHASNEFNTSLNSWVRIDADLMLFIFLPPLVFGEAMSLNWHHAVQVIPPSVTLAGPGVILGSLFLGVFIRIFIPHNFPWLLCFMTGAVLASTDTVAVLSIMHAAGASPKLTYIIVGESLLNDGTSMLMFELFLNLLKSPTFAFGRTVAFVLKMTVGSLLLGVALGLLTVRWLRSIRRPLKEIDVGMQVTITMIVAYLTFFIAQHVLEISGLLALVGAASMLAWLAPPIILNKDTMHHVWGFVEWSFNTVLFLLAGLIIGHRVLEEVSGRDWWYMFVIYVLSSLTRGLVIAVLFPLLSTMNTKLTRNEAFFAAFAGLRGAVGMALGLIIVDNADAAGISSTDASRIFFYIGGTVSLSLFINGSLAQWALNYWDLGSNDSVLHLLIIDQIKRKLRHKMNRLVDRMEGDLNVEPDAMKGVRMSVSILRPSQLQINDLIAAYDKQSGGGGGSAGVGGGGGSLSLSASLSRRLAEAQHRSQANGTFETTITPNGSGGYHTSAGTHQDDDNDDDDDDDDDDVDDLPESVDDDDDANSRFDMNDDDSWLDPKQITAQKKKLFKKSSAAAAAAAAAAADDDISVGGSVGPYSANFYTLAAAARGQGQGQGQGSASRSGSGSGSRFAATGATTTPASAATSFNTESSLPGLLMGPTSEIAIATASATTNTATAGAGAGAGAGAAGGAKPAAAASPSASAASSPLVSGQHLDHRAVSRDDRSRQTTVDRSVVPAAHNAPLTHGGRGPLGTANQRGEDALPLNGGGSRDRDRDGERQSLHASRGAVAGSASLLGNSNSNINNSSSTYDYATDTADQARRRAKRGEDTDASGAGGYRNSFGSTGGGATRNRTWSAGSFIAAAGREGRLSRYSKGSMGDGRGGVGADARSERYRTLSVALDPTRRKGNAILPEMLAYVRTLFLEIVRMKYWKLIEAGSLPRNSPSALFLLYSVDVGIEEATYNPHKPPKKTAAAAAAAGYAGQSPSTSPTRFANNSDSSFRTTGSTDEDPGLADWNCISKDIDITNMAGREFLMWWEARAPYCLGRDIASYILEQREGELENRQVYMLSAFIEAHEHAQRKIHSFVNVDVDEDAKNDDEQHHGKSGGGGGHESSATSTSASASASASAANEKSANTNTNTNSIKSGAGKQKNPRDRTHSDESLNVYLRTPEEIQVRAESAAAVARAKAALESIEDEVRAEIRAKQAAMQILSKEVDLVVHMNEEGLLNDRFADTFLEEIQEDREIIEADQTGMFRRRRDRKLTMERLSEIAPPSSGAYSYLEYKEPLLAEDR